LSALLPWRKTHDDQMYPTTKRQLSVQVVVRTDTQQLTDGRMVELTKGLTDRCVVTTHEELEQPTNDRQEHPECMERIENSDLTNGS